jgi:hypothetical protein
MDLRFQKAKHGTYRLEVRRDDGSSDARELQAGYLVHDLMHFAYETRMRSSRGFYGRVAAGRALDEAEGKNGTPDRAALAIEVVVGTLQGAMSHGATPELIVERASELLRTQGHAVPVELDAGLVIAVLADFRRLAGQWASLGVDDALELRFDPGTAR